MKIRFALLTAALAATQALAATDTLANEPVLSQKRLSGSLTAGYSGMYTGRGYVATQAVAGGEGAEFVALQLNYDVGKEGLWTVGTTIAYNIPSACHKLYGNPNFGPDAWVKVLTEKKGYPVEIAKRVPPGKIKQGSIILDGKNVLEMSEDELEAMRGNDVAMIFQDPMTALNPVLPWATRSPSPSCCTRIFLIQRPWRRQRKCWSWLASPAAVPTTIPTSSPAA